MKCKDLRDFIRILENQGELKKVSFPINPDLEVTEVACRTLKSEGPALLFTNPKGYSIPLLCNLFGTIHRIMLGIGIDKNITSLRDIGQLFAFLKEPQLPTGLRDFLSKMPHFSRILHMPIKALSKAVCQENIYCDQDVDITQMPIIRCWPGDISPLITWGITITRNMTNRRQNLGIYRQQVLSKNKIIIRWLSHRGGALDFQEWFNNTSEKRFPIAIALGADPATLIGSVIPVPNALSE